MDSITFFLEGLLNGVVEIAPRVNDKKILAHDEYLVITRAETNKKLFINRQDTQKLRYGCNLQCFL